MVTAELAACLPVLLLIVGVALAAVSIVGQRLRAQDAANEAARAGARGDASSAQRLVAQTAPAGASMTLASAGDDVVATVRVVIRPLGGMFGSYTITERAVCEKEPSTSQGSP